MIDTIYIARHGECRWRVYFVEAELSLQLYRLSHELGHYDMASFQLPPTVGASF